MSKKLLVFIIIVMGIFFILKHYELKKLDISQPIEIIQHQVLENKEETIVDKIETHQIQTDSNIIVNNNASSYDIVVDKPIEESKTIKESFILNDLDIFFGNKNSPIQLIEYFSFTCYHCQHYHSDIFPRIKENYIDTGKIGYVIREYVATKQDLDASILARCKGDKKSFIDFQTILLEKQMQWAYSSGYRDSLKFIGKIGGISEEKFDECLAKKDLVAVLIANTKEVGIHPDFIGTPAIFINGKKIKTYSFESISEAIEEQLK